MFHKHGMDWAWIADVYNFLYEEVEESNVVWSGNMS